MEVKFSDLKTAVFIAIALFTHFGALVWWGAGISAGVKENSQRITQELNLRDAMIKSLDDKIIVMSDSYKNGITDVRSSVSRIEAKLDRYIFDDRRSQ